MFKTFTNAWKVQDIRKKIFYILIVLAIYRFGTHIPLPGIDLVAWEAQMGANSETISLYALIAGGGFATVFAMGIGPYITSSIIFQLLTVAIPKLEQLKKEGEEGRKKINQYTRIAAVALATLQGSGMVYSFRSLFTHQNFLVYITAVVSMVTGTIFIMWLGEILTERAMGNGTSFIIFANILSGMPRAVSTIVLYMQEGNLMQYISIIFLLLMFIALMGFVVFIQEGERRIPVQYAKKMVGRQMFGGQTSYLPIKANIAGVMSIIFAISLLQFPSVIYQFAQNDVLRTIVEYLDIQHPVGAAFYVMLIFFFTFFYTSFSINPVEMAENLKKNGGSIPGTRPGKPTSDYIQRTIDRMSWIGACAYSIIALMPIIFTWIFKVDMGFGGTTLLIVTGVALEIVKQLEAQLLMRHYKGFLN